MLLNSLGIMIDSRNIQFFLDQQVLMQSSSNTTSSTPSTSIKENAKEESACSSCTGYTDVVCLILNKCWKTIGTAIGLILTFLLACYLTCFKCLPCKILCCFLKNSKKCAKIAERGRNKLKHVRE